MIYLKRTLTLMLLLCFALNGNAQKSDSLNYIKAEYVYWIYAKSQTEVISGNGIFEDYHSRANCFQLLYPIIRNDISAVEIFAGYGRIKYIFDNQIEPFKAGFSDWETDYWLFGTGRIGLRYNQQLIKSRNFNLKGNISLATIIQESGDFTLLNYNNIDSIVGDTTTQINTLNFSDNKFFSYIPTLGFGLSAERPFLHGIFSVSAGYDFAFRNLLKGNYTVESTLQGSTSADWKIRGNGLNLSVGYAYVFHKRPQAFPDKKGKKLRIQRPNSLYLGMGLDAFLGETITKDTGNADVYSEFPYSLAPLTVGYQISLKKGWFMNYDFSFFLDILKLKVNFDDATREKYSISYYNQLNTVSNGGIRLGISAGKQFRIGEKSQLMASTGLSLKISTQGGTSSQYSLSKVDSIKYPVLGTSINYDENNAIKPIIDLQSEWRHTLSRKNAVGIGLKFSFSINDYFNHDYFVLPSTSENTYGTRSFDGHSAGIYLRYYLSGKTVRPSHDLGD